MNYISLKDFINESISESVELNESRLRDIEINGTTEERRKSLEKFLEGEYPDYIDKLNEMLKDPKTAAILEEAFGGDLGDIQLKFNKKHIPVKKLLPTQSEIDLKNSILFTLCNPECIRNIFKPVVELGIPVVTLNGVFIIDGHHRWSQAYIFNRNCKMNAINFNGNLSPIEMLKATQGVIAAWKSEHGEHDKGVPSATVAKGFNIFDKSREEMEEFINCVLDGEIDFKGTKCNPQHVINVLSQYVSEVTDRESLIEYLCDGAEYLKHNSKPAVDAPNRGLMPQTDQAGSVGNDSAVQKLKDSKVLKVK